MITRGKRPFLSFLLLLFYQAHPISAKGMVHRDTIAHPTDTVLFQGEVLVTARRQGLSAFKLPAATALLQKEDLLQGAPRSVPEALQGTPGVFIQKTNHGGGSPFLRGLTGQQTLLLVDGIRMNNATFRSGPNQYLNTIDPSWPERIEVLLSSGSVEYGSDAIGGVIQVLTHALQTSTTTKWQPEANFKWTSGRQEAGVQAAINTSGRQFAFRMEGAYRDFGDLIGGKGIGRQTPTGYTQWSYSLKGLWKINDRMEFQALWQDLEQEEVPLYHRVKLENFRFFNFHPQRRSLGYARLSINADSKWWQKIEITASRQKMLEGRVSQKNGQLQRVEENDQNQTLGFQINALSNINRFWFMQTGAEVYADAVRSFKSSINTASGSISSLRGLYPDQSRMMSTAFYNLHTLNWTWLTLTGGLRYNQFRITIPDEVIGTSRLNPDALVGQFGASLLLFRDTRLFANAASAFRAPNIDDLGTLGIVDFRYELPNLQLNPEKSRNIELGLKWQKERFQGSISGYYLLLDGLIGRVRSGDTLQGYPVFLKQNITRAYIRGFEASGTWQLMPRWSLSGNGTYTFGQNLSANEPLRRIPPFHGKLQIRYLPAENLGFSAESQFAGAQRRLAAADKSDNRINPNGTPGWKVVHLRAWHEWKFYTLSMEWHNIFNEGYRMHGSGVDGMGRSLWISLGIRGI